MTTLGQQLTECLMPQQTREQRHLQTLLSVSEAIGGIRDTPVLMRRIMEQVTAAFQADRSSFFVHDPARRELRAIFAQGLASDPGPEICLQDTDGLCGEVFRTHQPLCVSDTLQNPFFANAPVKRTGYLPRSVLLAPVFAHSTRQRTCCGVLQVMDQRVGHFDEIDIPLLEAIAVQVAISLENVRLHEAQKNQFHSFVRAFGTALERRDPITATHSLNVANYAVGISHFLGMSRPDLEWIRIAGLLHDVGKIGVPEAVLTKPGKLEPDEYRQMKAHAEYSRQILGQIEFIEELEGLDFVASAHHEKLDGSGYPDGLRGDQVPLKARVLAVADIFDALTQERHYRTGMPIEEAMAVLEGMSPHQLDERCVAALKSFLGLRGG